MAWFPQQPPTAAVLAEYALRGIYPGSASPEVRALFWVVSGLLLAAAFAGVFALYFTERARLSFLQRLLPAAVRSALVGFVFLLLLCPVRIDELPQGDRPRRVVLLVDNSLSMRQRDRRFLDADLLRVALAKGLLRPGSAVTDARPLADLPPEQLQDAARIDLAKAVLANADLKLLDGLRGKGPLEALAFGRGSRPRSLPDHSPAGDRLDTLEKQLAALRADENGTALAESLHDLLRPGRDLPAAVVVVTDGRDQPVHDELAGSESPGQFVSLARAAEECGEKGVPLHVYGVGATELRSLRLKDVGMPSTVFVDDKPEHKDDPVTVPVVWQCQGFKQGTVVVTLRLGGQEVRREFPVREGNEIREEITFVPDKGKEGKRDFTATVELKQGKETYREQAEKVVQVKNSRVKALYVEEAARREYHSVKQLLNRDRRVLARWFLVEGDNEELVKARPDPDSGSLHLDAFPKDFPKPSPADPDKRPYDLLVLGDVAPKDLGDKAVARIQEFVKKGGGLVVIAGRRHTPADYRDTDLAKVLLPVELGRDARPAEARTQGFKPVLTYQGEQSALLALADEPEANLKLWKEELWADKESLFWWSYPVAGLRPGARTLLAHPELKVPSAVPKKGEKPAEEPMPVVAFQFYGKGSVLFLGVEETWRWRNGREDRLTARFWGQVATQLGLPHLLDDGQQVHLEVEGAAPVVGRPGAVKARLLDANYDPAKAASVRATLTYLDAPEGAKKSEIVELEPVENQPGEYRAALVHAHAGKAELRVDGATAQESAALRYWVELPARSELEPFPLPADELRRAAEASGGRFYREEDLHRLAAAVEPRGEPLPPQARVTPLLWNWLGVVVFLGLATTEWLLRKFSNLS